MIHKAFCQLARTHQKAKHRFAKLPTIMFLFRISEFGSRIYERRLKTCIKCIPTINYLN